MEPAIVLRGVRTNNLKNIDVEIPLGRLTMVTGVSGSGKSSLVFDTLFGEAYRRYVESLSSYARQYLQALPKPDMDRAEQLPPAISVRQVRSSGGTRSTVATATEIAELLRVLFAHGAEAVCTGCGDSIRSDSPESVLEHLRSSLEGQKILVAAPLTLWRDVWADKDPVELLSYIESQGFTRLLLDSRIIKIADFAPEPSGGSKLEVDANAFFSGSVIVDRMTLKDDSHLRFLDSVGAAFRLGRGRCALVGGDGETSTFSSGRECLKCGIAYPDPSPVLFSFNHPSGACPDCQGFGREAELDLKKMIASSDSSIKDQGVLPFNFGRASAAYSKMIKNAAKHGIDYGKKFSDYTDADWDWFMNGDGGRYGGVRAFFAWLDKKKYKPHYRMHAAKFRTYHTCRTCRGDRLNPKSLAFRIRGASIADILRSPLKAFSEWLRELPSADATNADQPILADAYAELRQRVRYLCDIGLGYLGLDRQASTLSGGEFQRLNMARCLSSALTETLFCIDEPSTGLHPQDSRRLLGVLQSIRDQGNTVVVVEHEQQLLSGADHLIRVGPGAGRDGGEVSVLENAPELVSDPLPAPVKMAESPMLTLKGATLHNLRRPELRIPLGEVTCVCGVSGSGKSTLIRHCLFSLVSEALDEGSRSVEIEALGRLTLPRSSAIEGVQLVDQSPPGRSSRSNIATYLGVFDSVRKLFSEQPLARKLGLAPGAFSFNVAGGRCEVCRGLGRVVEDLSFLGEVEVECPACLGDCFSSEILSVRYKDRSLMDVLAMTVAEAREFFFDRGRIAKTLQAVIDLGMGYLTLGQNTSSFSGGEAQRLKLLRILSDAAGKKASLFILDEPTTGLSDQDVARLFVQIDALKAAGHTLILVEHHWMAMGRSDWLVELGPGAGPSGGEIVYQGPPGGIVGQAQSPTGAFLAELNHRAVQ